MTAAIKTQSLTKDYGGGRGLFALDLEVSEGEVFGYLGPNGAGKSTTIRLLMGMIHPSRGAASILGLDSMRRSVEVKRLIGYMPGELPQFGGLRGRDIAGHFGALRGGVDQARVKEITERLDLDLGLKFRQYSTGNKRKLGILLAFMHRPKVLILDEPSSGLDPLNQQELFKLVREAKAAGATVFLSSHVLSEVEHVCERVGIIRRGRLVRVARLDELHEMRVRRVEVEFAGDAQPQLFEGLPGIENLESNRHRVTFTARGSFEPVADALAGNHVVNLASHEPTLEDVFLTYYEDQPDEVPA
ncbi:MAG: ABC transporter ATP-binding protein [Candidatus Dormibacteraeota bacterium]|uniref:ABC transporter ATP-binding protein n=1 Tax=Candidatus Dormiibacter inghamiae TaxID=3127013 RepID=A0A934NHY3_9BACT|nr:ABC transporter ATP-binding protein [Candidatus Dormibacteraeota bacterium]MBJ7606405.1 ABC transporter ATP-binding protein [Candidatus Dormibacteraeota bacterium]